MVNLHGPLSQHWAGQGCHWPSPLGTKVDITNSSNCPAIPRWRWALADLEYACKWMAVSFLVEWCIQYLAFIIRCEVCKRIGMGRWCHSCGTRGWSGFYIVNEHRTLSYPDTNLRLGVHVMQGCIEMLLFSITMVSRASPICFGRIKSSSSQRSNKEVRVRDDVLGWQVDWRCC